MQILTPPQLNEFFQRWAPLVNALLIFGIFGQIVSGLTESAPVYITISDNLCQFGYCTETPTGYQATTAIMWASITLTVFIVLLLELSLRASLQSSLSFLWEKINPQGIKKELTEEIKANKLGRIDRVLKTATVIYAVVCYILMLWISFAGSYMTTDFLTVKAAAINTEAVADSTRTTGENRADQAWKKDSLFIVSVFDGQITTTKKMVEADAAANLITAAKYEAIDATKYAARIANERASAARKEADGAGKVLKLETAKADSIANSYQRYQAGINSAATKATTAATTAQAANVEASTERTTKINKSGGKLAWFTVFGSFVLLLSLIFQTGVNHGSQRRSIHRESTLTYYPSVITEWLRARKERVLFNAHAKIYDYETLTPPPPLPYELNGMVDFGGTATAGSINVSTEQHEAGIFNLPVKKAIHLQEESRTIGFSGSADERRQTFRIINRTQEEDKRNVSAGSRNEVFGSVTRNTPTAGANVCACGCGRSLRGKRADAKFFDNACRARANRK